MQYSPVFGEIDFLTAENSFNSCLQVGLFGQVEQKGERFIGDSILGVIEQDIIEGDGKLREPLRILIEEVPHMDTLHFKLVVFKRFPGLFFNNLGHDKLLIFMTFDAKLSSPAFKRQMKIF